MAQPTHNNADFNHEETNADKKYYGYKKNRGSTIGVNSHAVCHRGPIGKPTIPVAKSNADFNHEETNSDKKYYGYVKPRNVQRASEVARDMKAVRPLQLSDDAKVSDVKNAVVAQLKAGIARVIVQVAEELSGKLEIQLDLAEAREDITPQQRSAVVFEPLPKNTAELAQQTFGAVDPKEVPPADDLVTDAEIADLVNSVSGVQEEGETAKPQQEEGISVFGGDNFGKLPEKKAVELFGEKKEQIDDDAQAMVQIEGQKDFTQAQGQKSYDTDNDFDA